MNQIVERLWTLLHEPVGPLAPYLDPFSRSLDEQGFKRHLLGRQIRVAARFSQWLQAQGVVVNNVTDEHVRRFFEGTSRQQSIRRGEFAALRRLIDFLGQLGIIHSAAERVQATQIQQIVGAFATYLRDERGLCEKTLIQYCPIIELFLAECFGCATIEPSTLRANDVIRFIIRQAARLSPARAKVTTTALRSFLRYLCYRGDIELDLAAAVPTVPNWSMTGIPRAIAPDHLHAVLSHCPRDTLVGRRDYAILLLLVRLGLRSNEIVSLTLESIDWVQGCIVVAGKGDQTATLPLPVEVGEAIADYLRHGRSINSSRALFLRVTAPIRGLGAGSSVGTIVSAAIKRAGIGPPHRGTHQFRHALATNMLRHGATLTEIGSILRHRHAKTTSLYAKVDFAAMRPLSLPWPGSAT